MQTVLSLLTRLLMVFTLAAYLSVLVSPVLFWPAAVLSLCIPLALLLNLLALAFWGYRRHRLFWLPLLALVAGWPFVKATFAWGDRPQATADFTVLTYNVEVFKLYQRQRGKTSPPENIVNWLVTDNADIKCLQEFYNEASSDVFNTTRRLKTASHPHVWVVPAITNRIGGQFGLAIFSRYPLVKKGKIDFDGGGSNGAIYADVATGKGTVRVVNVHLESLRMDEQDLQIDRNNYKYKSKGLLKIFRRAAPAHARQLGQLLKLMQDSPHPVIICGDFNETPYGYLYFQLKRHMYSAFEEAARGFGFTFNDSKLFFLRIDHQFFAEGLQVLWQETAYSAGFSDHFPVKAGYVFSREEAAAADATPR